MITSRPVRRASAGLEAARAAAGGGETFGEGEDCAGAEVTSKRKTAAGRRNVFIG